MKIGQVVSYMRKSRLRHGFLSTYEHTVFVKRDDDYSFHLSMPVSHTAVNPSLRECFVGFAITAAQNPRYQELHALDERLVSPPSLLMSSKRKLMKIATLTDHTR